MEHSPIKYPGDDDAEDGEISDASDGVYTPLARPNDIIGAGTASGINADASGASTTSSAAAGAVAVSKMEEASDKDDSGPDDYSSTDSDSDNAIIGQPRDRTKRHKMRNAPMKPTSHVQNAVSTATPAAVTATGAASAPRRKNNIWAAGLQEESLMENLKGCGVDRESSGAYDRSVESYDYSLRFRLNGESALKRRKSSNSDSSNEPPQTKYFRQRNQTGGGGGGHHHGTHQQKKKSVKQRLGRRDDDSSSNDATAGLQLTGPRIICDLDDITEHSTNESVAKDLANKLQEEKDELMLRIIEILGNDLPVRMFGETQRIELNGGMMIMNGKRRRTPGGVFLFLLKNDASLSAEHRRSIFTEESRKQNREQKLAQAQKRDRKVEQLKQTLRIENELSALAQRSNDSQSTVAATSAAAVAVAAAAGGAGRDDPLNNLSNPPPSPVTDGNRENSSDFDTHKPGVTTTNAYEDDFLEMHCDDVDMF